MREERVQPFSDHGDQQQWAQLTRPGDQRVARRPVLAHHALRLVTGPVIEIFLELALDDAALFLDNQHLFLVGHEGQRIAARQRPDHADLVDVDAEPAAGGLIQPEQPQRLHQVEMPFAGGHDPVARIGNVVDPPVNRIGLHEGLDRVQLGAYAGFNLRARHVGRAYMQATRRRREHGLDECSLCRDLDRLARLNRFRDRLEPDPGAGKP